jgi:hypothetical protein
VTPSTPYPGSLSSGRRKGGNADDPTDLTHGDLYAEIGFRAGEEFPQLYLTSAEM